MARNMTGGLRLLRGADTDQVLADLGYSPAPPEDFRERKII